MPAANWPKLENKRNIARINVEDAREENTPVYEELFAAWITLNRLRHFSIPDLKSISFYVYPYALFRTKDFYCASSTCVLSSVLKVDDFRKRNSTRGTLMVDIFCDLRNIALSRKFASNQFLSSNRRTLVIGNKRLWNCGANRREVIPFTRIRS